MSAIVAELRADRIENKADLEKLVKYGDVFVCLNPYDDEINHVRTVMWDPNEADLKEREHQSAMDI